MKFEQKLEMAKTISEHWKPFPVLEILKKGGAKYSSQELFLSSGADINNYIREVLYQGSRGIGKTLAMLVAFAMHVDAGYTQWRGVIFRKVYKSLPDIINKSKELFASFFGDRAIWKASMSEYKWVFNNHEGKQIAELEFRAIDNEEDYEKFHGQEYQFIGFEELATWKDMEVYRLMKSCNRCSRKHNNDKMPPLLMRSTSNPFGAGSYAVYQYFMEKSPVGHVFDKQGSSKLCLYGVMDENIYMDSQQYAKTFEDYSPREYNAFRYGLGWGEQVDTMFSDYFETDIHYIKPFKIPSNWYVDRSLDYGSTSPFSVLWYAESNGESFKDGDGKTITVPKGSIFVIKEWYGCKSSRELNKGLKMDPAEISATILRMDRDLKTGLLSTNHKINDGPADNAIWADKDVVNGKCIAKLLENKGKGTNWKASNKNKGSRIAGAEYFKSMLTAARKDNQDSPHIYFFDTCKFLRTNILSLDEDRRNPGDVDTTMNDHDWDGLRYRILSSASKKSKMIHNYK